MQTKRSTCVNRRYFYICVQLKVFREVLFEKCYRKKVFYHIISQYPLFQKSSNSTLNERKKKKKKSFLCLLLTKLTV